MYRLYGSRNSYIDVVYSVKATDTEDNVYSREISSLSSAPSYL